MSTLLGLRHRLRALLFPAAHARDLVEEMRFHLELDEMHHGEARQAALRFGNRTYYQEEVRRMTWYGAFDVVRQDARFAWRGMLRKPGFTAMVVLTLALGIGVNAATFSVLDLLFLRGPGGIENASGLRRFHVQHFNTGDGVPFFSQALNYPTYRELAAATGDSTRTALFTTENRLRLGKHPRDPKVRGVYASASYFRVLGARTVMGRVYNDEEDRLGSGAPVVVVSHRFWKSRLGADSAALGKDIDIGGRLHKVVGVLDPRFGGVELQASDVWMPLAMIPVPRWVTGPWWEDARNMTRFRAIYRLAPGTSETEIALRATGRIRALQRTLYPQRPDTQMTVRMGGVLEARAPGKPGHERIISTRLGGVALIVMLIACANVINLLLARAVRRRHEFSIRLALGISPSRLMRLLTTEALLLALVALLPAVLAAWWGAALLRALLLPEVEWYEAALTWRVVAFAFGTAMLAGLIAGIIPALQSRNPDLNNALKAAARAGGAHRSRLRTGLVVMQAALSLVLLTGSALFVRSLHNVQAIDIGFDANRLVFGSVSFAEGEKPPAAVLDAALRDVAIRMQRRAGVESVARSWFEPMRGLSWLDFFTAHDSSGSFEHGAPTVSTVSPSFFTTVGMRVLRGRVFTGSDVGGAAPPEVVVNEAMAKRLWPGEEAIGQCMRFKSRDSACHTVVGVAENARRDQVIEPDAALQYYIPLGSPAHRAFGETLILRTNGSSTLAVKELRDALRAALPSGEPSIQTMMENLEPEYRPWQLGARLFTSFGALALVVALIGIYSTVSYGVAQRTHEFGVRIALGARLGDLLRQVVGEGVRTVFLGIGAGVLLVLAAGRLIASLLYGVAANDPVTMALVAVTMLAAATLAAVVPAWRAARVDPVTALRSD
jgi:putative ABC transport system permease protein